MHRTFTLVHAAMTWLKVQNKLWRTKENRSEHGRRRRKRREIRLERERKTDSGSAVRHKLRKRKTLVGQKTPNVILHSLHGVQGRREEEREAEGGGRRKNGGRVRGRKKGGGWQERKFNLAPDGQPHRHSHKISTLCEWHRSPFGDFPSSQIRLDICPPPPLPGPCTEADSQIKIARGTIQTLLPFCWECLLTALDLRG